MGAECTECVRLRAINAELLESCKKAMKVVDEAYLATGFIRVAKTSLERMAIESAIAKAEGTPPPVSGGSPAEELPPGVQALREVALAGIEGYDCRMQCWEDGEKIIDIITPDPADPTGMPRAIEGRRQHDEGWAIWRGERRRDVP